MSESPTLDVVVLTYNSGRTIKYCLDSLVSQKFKQFNLLVVDDCSTDDTIKIVKSYRDKLKIKILMNGSHIVAKGRNIGLRKSSADIVAFVDSDDAAVSNWTDTIMKSFVEEPEVALISGPFLPSYRNITARVIATNDEVIRHLFGGGVLQFGAGNCALNRNLIGQYFFDDDFVCGEDLELISRLRDKYTWRFVEDMKIHYNSRSSFKDFFKQMHNYGQWKLFYGFKARDYRLIDFVPLSIMVLSIVTAIVVRSLLPISTIIFFSLAESLFVILYRRPVFLVSLLTFPAWIIKNIAWSLGIMQGLYILSTSRSMRNLLISKR